MDRYMREEGGGGGGGVHGDGCDQGEGALAHSFPDQGKLL